MNHLEISAPVVVMSVPYPRIIILPDESSNFRNSILTKFLQFYGDRSEEFAHAQHVQEYWAPDWSNIDWKGRAAHRLRAPM